MAKGVQKINKRLYYEGDGYGSDRFINDRNLKGVNWPEIVWRDAIFVEYIKHYISTMPFFWKRAQMRYVYRIKTETSRPQFEKIIEKIYLNYRCKGQLRPKFSEYFKWRSELLHGYGKWVICSEMHIDRDLINAVEI